MKHCVAVHVDGPTASQAPEISMPGPCRRRSVVQFRDRKGRV